MQKILGISVVALLLAVPLIADDAGPVRLDDVPSVSSTPDFESAPQFLPQVPSAASSSGTIHRTVVVNEPYTVTDEKTGRQKTLYRQVTKVLSQRVLTDPAEIETTRKRLKELQDRRIDRLSAEELAAEELDLTLVEKEREAWVKLQGIRDLLKKVVTEFPSTEASRIAAEAQNLIPATEAPLKPAAIPAKPSSPLSDYAPGSHGIRAE